MQLSNLHSNAGKQDAANAKNYKPKTETAGADTMQQHQPTDTPQVDTTGTNELEGSIAETELASALELAELEAGIELEEDEELEEEFIEDDEDELEDDEEYIEDEDLEDEDLEDEDLEEGDDEEFAEGEENPVMYTEESLANHLEKPSLIDFVDTQVITVRPKLTLALDISNSEVFTSLTPDQRQALTEFEGLNSTGSKTVKYNMMQPLSKPKTEDGELTAGWLRAIISKSFKYGRNLSKTPMALVGSHLDTAQTIEAITEHLQEVLDSILRNTNFNADEMGIETVSIPMEDISAEDLMDSDENEYAEDESSDLELEFDTFARVAVSSSYIEDSNTITLDINLAIQFPALYVAKDPVKTIAKVYELLAPNAERSGAELVVTASSSDYFNEVARTRKIVDYLVNKLHLVATSSSDMLEDDSIGVDAVTDMFQFGGDMLLSKPSES